ncbi:MAG TPA: ClbS/DfsB family four-helix bundle protein [Phototrophicaceae bacterium]|nr:ClbS/DfsB family four-helix bundle protein [Phototrophicaceae bacterium]
MTTLTKADLLEQMQTGWVGLSACLKMFNAAQMTGPTDAGGWTIKDHLAHLSAWESGLYGLLQGQSMRAVMGLDAETWQCEGFDPINAVLYQQHRNEPLDEVLHQLFDQHPQLTEKVEAMSAEDLQKIYDIDGRWQVPIGGFIAAVTYRHFQMHQPWIEALVQ